MFANLQSVLNWLGLGLGLFAVGLLFISLPAVMLALYFSGAGVSPALTLLGVTFVATLVGVFFARKALKSKTTRMQKTLIAVALTSTGWLFAMFAYSDTATSATWSDLWPWFPLPVVAAFVGTLGGHPNPEKNGRH